MRKAPLKKRVTRGLRPRSNVDPTRMAVAALERIRTVLVKSGYEERLREPLSMKELAAQAQLLGTELPPSYVAAMRVASQIGEPDTFLSSSEMAAEAARIDGDARYAPFCRGVEHLVCFDTGGGKRLTTAVRHQGELPVIEWRDGSATPVAAHFGEWLDSIADAREESVETAANMPQRLKRLLYELGFRFEYPVVGRLETGDAAAIVELVGPDLARTVRGDVDRLFDSSGKASLTLNVDEFTLAASLRTGIYVFEAEDVFRWLRTFRDENFFSDAPTEPGHRDAVRDLRLAAREPPLVRRGMVEIAAAPSPRLAFRAASGAGADDFYLLGRTSSTSEHAPSIVLHVEGGQITRALEVNEPLHDVYVGRDGTPWGLTHTHAIRVHEGRLESFPLRRPTHGRAWWHGIGGCGDRVLVWGAGALLEFDGREFVPFVPDARLEADESVVAVHAQGLRLSMLVCGDHVGALARFDSVQWQPIGEDQVIDGTLVDLDVWRGVAHVLDRDGGVWKVEDGPPARVALRADHQAFLTEGGAGRPIHSVRAIDGGLLLGSTGGVIAVTRPSPLFHAIPNGRDPVRLVRVGGPSGVTMTEGEARDAAIVALSGANAWVWHDGRLSPVDASGW